MTNKNSNYYLHEQKIKKQVYEEFKEIIRQNYPVTYLNIGEKIFSSDDLNISLRTVNDILNKIILNKGELKMFHNNYKVYQVDFDQYNVEIEYWNEYTNQVEYTNLNLNKLQLNKLIDLLHNLDFDDNTPED